MMVHLRNGSYTYTKGQKMNNKNESHQLTQADKTITGRIDSFEKTDMHKLIGS